LNSGNPSTNAQKKSTRRYNRIKVLAILATFLGIAVFFYYVYAIGLRSVLSSVADIGFAGFALILGMCGLKLLTRACAWHLTVYDPNSLKLKDTFPAVVIGEALSSVFPLGIVISGTAKAVAVRKKIPIVVGLASVATENLFYSLITGLFISVGAAIFARQFALPSPFGEFVDIFVVLILCAMFVVALMVFRQWHWVSNLSSWLYNRHVFRWLTGPSRFHLRAFENLIYGFYRRHPKRFLPLCGLQVLFHLFGIFEVWFVLTKISSAWPSVLSAFYLESMSRLVTIVFKLVPLMIGVDEASAEFVVETLGIVAGIGVTLAILRKGRTLFWALIGFMLIAKHGFSIRDVREIRDASYTAGGGDI
jgi:hypothetical protein